jgi:hypothetical protein
LSTERYAAARPDDAGNVASRDDAGSTATAQKHNTGGRNGRTRVRHQGTIARIMLTAALCAFSAGAQAFDDAQYPDLRGQWSRVEGPGVSGGEPSFDPSKPPGTGQQAPLTPEYQAIFEANLREQQAGAPGTWPGRTCLPPGLPAQMAAYRPLEFVVLPDVTYVRTDYVRETRRRIFTDGRAWPKEVEDGFDGYSIGKWKDEDGDGKYDVLEVETRHFKGPRNFDLSGIPLHEDNETVIKERIFLDKADRDLLHDEMTVMDHALTRPWTVMKTYRRSADTKPQWGEYLCVWESKTVRIGDETYLLDAEGFLKPSKMDQPPPSLQYFPKTK